MEHYVCTYTHLRAQLRVHMHTPCTPTVPFECMYSTYAHYVLCTNSTTNIALNRVLLDPLKGLNGTYIPLVPYKYH